MQEQFLISFASVLASSILWLIIYLRKLKSTAVLANRLNSLEKEFETMLNERASLKVMEIQNRASLEIEQSYHRGFEAGEARSKQVIEEWQKKFTLEVQPFKKISEKNLGLKGLFTNKKYHVIIGHRMRLLCDSLPSAFVLEEIHEEFTVEATQIEEIDQKMLSMASAFIPGLKKLPFAVKMLGKVVSGAISK